MISPIFDVRVGGDYACFSRPEFKVERVSYLMMTPSAARGLLESIFWKPAFRWRIREISLLSPIRQMALLRNEISTRQDRKPIVVEDQRQQRTSLILRDVRYLIRAELVLKPQVSDPVLKYLEMFQRRLERGQCHHTPYLGTREFPAWFESGTGTESPCAISMDLGSMLFDIAYRERPGKPEIRFYKHEGQGKRIAGGDASALFFAAEIKDGILKVPPEKYQELEMLEAAHA
jgi:CRISPR-associated protein Cas5d